MFYAPEVCYTGDETIFGGVRPKISGAVDLWALGICTYAMVYARFPFTSDSGHMGLAEQILQPMHPKGLAQLACVCTSLCRVVTRLPEGVWQQAAKQHYPCAHPVQTASCVRSFLTTMTAAHAKIRQARCPSVQAVTTCPGLVRPWLKAARLQWRKPCQP